MTDEALERYRSLVAKAVGIDLKRGDEVQGDRWPFYGVAPEISLSFPRST